MLASTVHSCRQSINQSNLINLASLVASESQAQWQRLGRALTFTVCGNVKRFVEMCPTSVTRCRGEHCVKTIQAKIMKSSPLAAHWLLRPNTTGLANHLLSFGVGGWQNDISCSVEWDLCTRHLYIQSFMSNRHNAIVWNVCEVDCRVIQTPDMK